MKYIRKRKNWFENLKKFLDYLLKNLILYI